MFELDVPGFGSVRLEHVVTDFTGTLSVNGKLVTGVMERLKEITGTLNLKVHVLTADTFGMARQQLQGLECDIHILTGENHDVQKEDFVRGLVASSVIALGNGKNDRRMLALAKIGIAVCLEEGCATDALKSADILVKSPVDALDLLLNPNRLKATLRY